MQRRRHSADRPHLVVEAKPRKGSVRLRRPISREPRRRHNNKVRRTDRLLRKVGRSVRLRQPRQWAGSVDHLQEEVGTVARRLRNIVSKATRSRLGKAIAPWVIPSLSIKCSRVTLTELPPVVAARSKRRRSRPRSVLRRRKVVSVDRLLLRPALREVWVLEPPPQGEGHRCSKRTTPITRAEARRISRRSNNRRRPRSLIRINNTGKIKLQCQVVLVARRRRIKALADRLRVSSRRRNLAEDFPPPGEGVRRRRTVDLRSLPPSKPHQGCSPPLLHPWGPLRRSIRIRRAACFARFFSRTKTIRREISGRCSVVA